MKSLENSQRGFSMIEVLVSLIVIGVGMLGLSGLQIASMKGTNNAHSRNIANMLTMELSDRMRANSLGVEDGFYENDVNCNKNEAQCRSSSFCTPEQLARLDVQEVMCGVLKAGKREGGIANLLPNGSIQIDHNVDCDTIIENDNETTITISWNEYRVHKDQAEDVEDQTTTNCVIP